jgi:predicted transport protein
MEGLVSFGNKRTWDDFKKQIPVTAQPLFDHIRGFCLSLGNNVVEDIRMHRIVFGKSLSLRWFADLEPQENGIRIKIQKNRKEVPHIVNVKVNQETAELEENLRNAFEEIH